MPIDRVRRTYDRRAPLYNPIVRALSLGGDARYRRRAVDALQLRPGQRVLDVGCGTGLNFRWIAEKIGPHGLMVGADLSLGMLRQTPALPRLRRLQAAAHQRVFRPASFDAVLCTYVISTLLDEQVVDPLLDALKPGGRLVVADDTLPPGWFIGPGFMLARLLRRGWPDLRADTIRALRPRLSNFAVAHCHYGMIFIISGNRR